MIFFGLETQKKEVAGHTRLGFTVFQIILTLKSQITYALHSDKFKPELSVLNDMLVANNLLNSNDIPEL